MEPLVELLAITCGLLAILAGALGIVVLNLLNKQNLLLRKLARLRVQFRRSLNQLTTVTEVAERDLGMCDCHARTGV